ncbi:efflux pump antibiotic resistance protein [Amylocystis lapponica]|nr:efflux pump antibiotic resistance protein [Amylocystis lapponica]
MSRSILSHSSVEQLDLGTTPLTEPADSLDAVLGSGEIATDIQLRALGVRDGNIVEESRSLPIAIVHPGDLEQGIVPHLSDQTNLLPKKQLMFLFPGLAITLFVAYLDQTVVTTALPSIASSFNAGNEISWVGTAYLMSSTAAQPLYGRLSDIFGRKYLLLFAVFTFVIGSILCAVARSMTQLIVFRGFAGVGGGGIISMVMIIMSDVVTLRERGKYQGYLGVSMALSGGIGPLVGGLFSQLVSWRWCFWINVPIEMVAIVAIVWLLPLKKVEGSTRQKLKKIDYLGVAIIVTSIVLVLLSLNWGGTTFAWDSVQILCTLLIGVTLMAVFILVEGRLAQLPIVPLHIFRSRTVVGLYFCTFATGIVYMVQLYYLPQFYQVVRGDSAIRSGAQLIPILLSQTLGSYAGAYIVTKTGRCRPIILAGFALWTLGIGLLSSLRPTTRPAPLVLYSIMCGAGAGATFQTTLVSLQGAVARREMAVATAVRNFFRAVGGIAGLAVAGAVLNNTLEREFATHGIPRGAADAIIADPLAIRGLAQAQAQAVLAGYMQGLRNVFRLCIPAAGLSLFAAFFLIAHQDLTREDDEARKLQAQVWLESRKEKHAKNMEDNKVSREQGGVGIEMVPVAK